MSLPAKSTLPDELSDLLTAFHPSRSHDERSTAYLQLSAFCQGVRGSTQPQNSSTDTDTLTKAFGIPITSLLAGTDEAELFTGLSFFIALFQTDRESASAIFQQDGVIETTMDIVDLYPVGQLAQHVAHLLSQACSHKLSRSTFTPQSLQWLEHASKSSKMELRTAATVALIKYSKASASDRSEAMGDTDQGGEYVADTLANSADLAVAMMEVVLSEGNHASFLDAIEGLAYLSVEPGIKDQLSRNSTFLKRLFALVPSKKSPSTNRPTSILVYGILVVILNLCTYRPRLSEEEAQVQKLRQMANAGKNSIVKTAFDDDEIVRERIYRLVDLGVLDVFAPTVHIESSGIRQTSSKALLSIIEDQRNRGKVLQSGCAKVLMSIIRHAFQKPGSPSTSDPSYLDAIQALAKLSITASPVQVFGPNQGAMYDAIRPFSFMLQGAPSTLLQKFESMMALTNLSSHSAELASRIARSENLINRVELLILEEHALVRRAAMELLCNLIAGSDDVFERYGGGPNTTINGVKSRLQIIVALSDVDDLPTRLAASGALAILTSAVSACQGLAALQSDKHRVFTILTHLVDPSLTDRDENTNEISEMNPGLRHRAIVCTRNVFVNISDRSHRKALIAEAMECRLTEALVQFLKSEHRVTDEPVLRNAAEALKIMLEK